MPSARAAFRWTSVSSTSTQRLGASRSRAATGATCARRASAAGAEHRHVLDRDHRRRSSAASPSASQHAQRIARAAHWSARTCGPAARAAPRGRGVLPTQLASSAGQAMRLVRGNARRGRRGGAPGRAASRRSAASSAGAAGRPPRSRRRACVGDVVADRDVHLAERGVAGVVQRVVEIEEPHAAGHGFEGRSPASGGRGARGAAQCERIIVP